MGDVFKIETSTKFKVSVKHVFQGGVQETRTFDSALRTVAENIYATSVSSILLSGLPEKVNLIELEFLEIRLFNDGSSSTDVIDMHLQKRARVGW